jgi:hypothetical protein
MQDNWWNLLDGTTPQMVANVALGVAMMGVVLYAVIPAIMALMGWL